MEFILNTIDDLTMAAPRFNAIVNTYTTVIPNNYKLYDAVNGDYDKYFPCYALNTNSQPEYKLIDKEGRPVKVIGDLTCYVYRDKYKGRKQGIKDDPDIPYNTNLEQQVIYESEYRSTKLNPSWTAIQLQGGVPIYLVRVLGNTKVTEAIFSNELEATGQLVNFPKGTIVKYKNVLYKAIKNTEGLPDINIDQWVKIPTDLNVFKADIFILTSGGSSYLTEVTDPVRKFTPIEDTGDNLICFNVSYYHS